MSCATIPQGRAASAKALSLHCVRKVSGTATGPVGLEQREGAGGGSMRGHNVQILVTHSRALVFILSETGSF